MAVFDAPRFRRQHTRQQPRRDNRASRLSASEALPLAMRPDATIVPRRRRIEAGRFTIPNHFTLPPKCCLKAPANTQHQISVGEMTMRKLYRAVARGTQSDERTL